MGDTLKKMTVAALGTAIAWAAAIKPRTEYGTDFSILARYDYGDGGLKDFYSGIPENSLLSVKKAIDNGYGVKIDVRLTKDGIPIAFADHDLFRICGVDGSVEETPWKDLKDLKLLETKECICTLKEVLDKVNGDVPIIINLISWRDNYGSLCLGVKGELEHYDGVFAVESFDYRILHWFKAYEPEILRGQILERQTYTGRDLFGIIMCFARNCLLTNFISSPDFISVNYHDRRSVSLMYCKLLYHVPVVYFNVSSDKEYELSRYDDAGVVFEDIKPGD